MAISTKILYSNSHIIYISSQPVATIVSIPIDSNGKRRNRRDAQGLPLDQVKTARGFHNVAQLVDVERESSILKLLLHDTPAKDAKVAKLMGAVAVRLPLGEVAEGIASGPDPVAVALDDLAGVGLGAGDAGLQGDGQNG